jgi:acyl-CoA dehydrogenase
VDPRYPVEAEEFRAEVRSFLAANLPDDWPGMGALDRAEAEAFAVAWRTTLYDHGMLGIAWPREYGGGGRTKLEQVVLTEELARARVPFGRATDTTSVKIMGNTLLRWGTEEQKHHFLPRILSGEDIWVQGFSEPDAGSDLANLKLVAHRDGDSWVLNGQKIWTSRAQHSDLMVLLARTTPLAEVEKRTAGLSVFLLDLRELGDSVTIKPIATMMNHSTTEVFFDDADVPADALIGELGQGFRYILDGMNAERTLIASECIGDGRFFIDRGAAYARERVVFGRPIGANQGVQFPLARAHAALAAASLARHHAAWLFDQGLPCGAEAGRAKLLASEASWMAANACLDTHGGFGFAVDYDIERKFRETRLYQVAPVSNNLVLAQIAQHELALPRAY